MPKPRNLVPTVHFHIKLPEPLHALMTLHLFSEIEGRVPHGKYMDFVSALIKGYFESARMDLAPWTGQPAGIFEVSGSPESVALLKKTLEEDAVSQ